MCRPDGRHVFFKGKVQMITYLLYIMLENGENIIKEKRDIFLHSIGVKLGNKLKEQIVTELNEQINQMEE